MNTESVVNNHKKEIKPYIHIAKYYETDQMAVIHHSNYIRWFEEARVDFLDQIGFGYDKMEQAGILSPVISVSCDYKSSVRFNEQVAIQPKLEFFNGIKMNISYLITDVQTNQIRAIGESNHCFVAADFKPISLKKYKKELYDLLTEWIGV